MYFLFDIGGTKTRFALSRDGKSFDDPDVLPTPEKYDVAMQMFKDYYQRYSEESEIVGAAGGTRGVLDDERKKILNVPKLTDWIDKPLKKNLEEIMTTDVYIENDTSIVGLGEAVYGAGKGYLIVAYITISTGVGGARIVDRKIDVARLGFEPGHQVIDLDGSVYPEAVSHEGGGVKGHLEAYVSGTAFEKRYGKKPEEIKDEKIWKEVEKFIAYGLNNTIVHWSPDVVVLGGGMMKSPGLTVKGVESQLKDILVIFPKMPVIKRSELGDFGGLYGALAYLKGKEETS